MATEKFTAGEIIEAIKKNNGIMAKAAQGLGCSRTTIANYINNYPTVKAAYDEANETNIDFVESKLMSNISNGDTTAIIFFLKTKAKNRGYVEKQEFDTNNTTDTIIRIVHENVDIASTRPA